MRKVIITNPLADDEIVDVYDEEHLNIKAALIALSVIVIIAIITIIGVCISIC